jgi:hypothetical protein
VRRIKRAKITFVSLCPRGKNQLPVLFKDDGTVELRTLVKSEAEGELTALVYVPERADTDGDHASAQVIKEMAHDYLRDGGKIDLRHDGKALPKDKAYVAQSFIVQKGDPRFEGMTDYNGKPVDAAGGWGMVVKIDDPELQQLYKDGQWNGVSMFGTAEFEQSKEDEGVLQKLLTWAKERFGGQPNQEEPDMTEKKEFEALQKSVADLAGLVKGLVSEREAEKAEAAKVAKEAEDKTQAEELARLKKENEELKKAKAEGDEKPEELVKAEAELAKAQAEVEKLKKASNQDTKDRKDDAEDMPDGISKEDQDLFKMGAAWGEALNKDEE